MKHTLHTTDKNINYQECKSINCNGKLFQTIVKKLKKNIPNK